MADHPYWSEEELFASDDKATFLAVGDSWFWYPVNNLMTPINNLLRIDDAILVLGGIGAETGDYLRNRQKKVIVSNLKKVGGWGNYLKAVFLSGGGNDIAGPDDMDAVLKDDCSGATTPSDCFDSDGLNEKMDSIISNHEELINLVGAELPEHPVFVHCYDYAIPTGEGFLGLGQWLKYPMDKAKVPVELQQEVVNELIDRLANGLATLAANNDKIELVDSRGTLDPDMWANELHPKASGFNRLARGPWKRALLNRGLL